eukprot:13784085-Alexandrium_andersonii.AAC.1
MPVYGRRGQVAFAFRESFASPKPCSSGASRCSALEVDLLSCGPLDFEVSGRESGAPAQRFAHGCL